MSNKVNIDLNKRQLVIDLPKKLSMRQQLLVKQLAQSPRILFRYIESFRGVQTASIFFADNLKSTGIECVLKAKRKNCILEIQKQKRDLFSDYPVAPTIAIPNGKAIGVEIECLLPNTIPLADLKTKFDSLKLSNIRIAEDGSLRSEQGYRCHEFRILTRVDDLSNLKAFCEFLKLNKAKVNATCGLHVHLDARAYARTPKAMVERLRTALPMLIAMQPRSRRNNTYCERDVSSGNRYAKINRESFRRHKTIEVRMHSGTVNFEKISNWVAILHSIAFSRAKITDSSPIGYARMLNWPNERLEYVIERIGKFKNDVQNGDEDSELRQYSCADCDCSISQRQHDEIGRCNDCDQALIDDASESDDDDSEESAA